MKPTEFDDYLKRLVRDLRKLEATKDGQGRKLARRRVLTSLRLLRWAVDRDYPAIIVKAKFTRLKTYEGKLARARKAGWCIVIDYAPLVALGVRVKLVKGTDRRGREARSWLAPNWAVAVIANGGGRAEMIEAKHSHNAKKAALAAAAL